MFAYQFGEVLLQKSLSDCLMFGTNAVQQSFTEFAVRQSLVLSHSTIVCDQVVVLRLVVAPLLFQCCDLLPNQAF